MSDDLTNAMTVLGGIVTAVTGGIFWARNNRTANSKAKADQAANYADAAVHQGQGDEIVDLRKRISALDTAFVSHSARIALLEAVIVGADTHIDNLVLCKECTKTNKSILDAMVELLAKAKEKKDKEHKHDVG